MTDLPDAKPSDPRIIDTAGLRGLAHPLRMRLISALESSGKATASQLAAQLGESSGSTSYHLRQLGKHGFIEEVAGAGSERQRFWQLRTGGWTLPPELFEPGAGNRSALDFVLRSMLQETYDRTVRFLSMTSHWPQEWREGSGIRTSHPELNPAQLAAFGDEAEALLDKYKALAPGPGARRVFIEVVAFPHGDPPTESG